MATDPFFGTNPIMEGLEARRGYVEQLRQNASRLAQSYNFVETTGAGSIKLPTAVEFHCTFVEIPVVGYGFTLESELKGANLPPSSSTVGQATADFPTSVGGVYSWITDTRGFYIGCYVYVVVAGGADADTVMQHDFTFTGIAMKDLPEYLLDL